MTDLLRPHLVERAVLAMQGRAAAVGPAIVTAAPPAAPVVTRIFDPAPKPSETIQADLQRAEAISLERMQKAGLAVAPAGSRTRLSEEFSVVQQQILRSMEKPDPTKSSRIVLVTSARPNEGKSFNALNIAASLAAYGACRVLLVDVDPKRGSLSELLGLGNASGLRDLALDPEAPFAPWLVPTAIERMQILPHGGRAPNAAPPAAAVAAAVVRLAQRFPDHAIILDSPPCLSTSDPGTLAPVAGQVVMVVEAERTSRGEVEAALDMVDACPTLQLLLNQARLNANDTFGAYYGTAYYG